MSEESYGDDLIDEQGELMAQRIAEHEADPESAIPWQEMKARLVERYGE